MSKVVITSDTHFGDPNCALIKKVNETKDSIEFKPHDKFDIFLDALGDGCDYLVLLGDVFDFSIESYANTFIAAKAFFSNIPEGKINEAIIYVPGNHDFEFWHLVETEVNVFKQISDGNSPRDFRWSVPGVFDFRSKSTKDEFSLPIVSKNEQGKPYGGLFLDKLTNAKIPFYVAYPNLYCVNDKMTVLITHGQYLEVYWSLLGEITPKIFGADLDIGPFMDLKELVALNFMTNQLASSGVGQSGPLTERIRFAQRKIKDHDIDALRKYIRNLDEKVLDPFFDYRRFHPMELVTDSAITLGKKKLVALLEKIKNTQFREEFEKDPDVQERVKKYYLASIAEIDALNDTYGYDKPSKVPDPTHVIYGHTHVPRRWSDNTFNPRIEGKTVRLHNTGGWLNKKGKFVGAEIFNIDENGDIGSETIS